MALWSAAAWRSAMACALSCGAFGPSCATEILAVNRAMTETTMIARVAFITANAKVEARGATNRALYSYHVRSNAS